MKELNELRTQLGISQRKLAELAGVSFRTVQLVDSYNTTSAFDVPAHNLTITTLLKLSRALGYGEYELFATIKNFFKARPDSLRSMSRRVSINPANWKLELFDFVDDYRRSRSEQLILDPPDSSCEEKFQALFASVVESLCAEVNSSVPDWTEKIGALTEPWFVAGIENLKAMALVESPIHFRKRNIFVLNNFLSRA